MQTDWLGVAIAAPFFFAVLGMVLLGRDQDTGQPVYIPEQAFCTHVHMPGATGKGKTTALETMLFQLLNDPRRRECHLIVDFMGGLSWDLNLWMSSSYCLPHVRERLVLIEPWREDRILPINPLLFDSLSHGYFKVSRGTELILRAWDSQNIGEMPRLARWLFNSFWACAQMGLTIADTQHLLLPGSDWHKPILKALPERLHAEWSDLLDARSGEASRILESSRNRLKPFYESQILRLMFGSTTNNFNALRFMAEGRIVVLNLAPNNRISPQEQNAIAGLCVNEFLAAARSLPKYVRYPTYLWLDEFQRIVGPDIEYAIPEVRQLGIRLILAHQSFSQLKRGDTDLSSIIWQPQTRMIFGESGDDADLLAKELASLTYDPKRIKDEISHLTQMQKGHKIVELDSWGTTTTDAESWQEKFGTGWSNQKAHKWKDLDFQNRDHSDAKGTSGQESTSKGGNRSTGASKNTAQHLVAELETIEQLASRTYYSFEEQLQLWAQRVRLLRTGTCVLRLVNDDVIRSVNVRQTKPGPLALPVRLLYEKHPQAIEMMERLRERNFAQDLFVSPAQIEGETRKRLENVLRPVIHLHDGDRALPAPVVPEDSNLT